MSVNSNKIIIYSSPQVEHLPAVQMSVNSNKIIIYSSPQVEHLPAGQKHLTAVQTENTYPFVAESSVYHVPKRTTYRVKISNSKDLEILSTAAKLGLTSWVGGQKVRIVGVADKQSSELGNSHISLLESLSQTAAENVSGFLNASCTPHQVKRQYESAANGICLAASGGCSTTSVAVMSGSESCTLSASSNINVSHSEHSATCTSSQSQLCQTRRDQLLTVISHCQPSDSLTTTADTGMSSRQCRNGSLNSLAKPSSHCESTIRSSVLQNMPGVHYLGTVVISSHNISTNSAVQDSNISFHSRSVTDATVASAVKKFTESMNGNRLSNGVQVTSPSVGCVKNNHVQTAGKTLHQPLNQSQHSVTISAGCLKRPFVENDKSGVVSPKRMAHGVRVSGSLDCAEASNVSKVTNSRSHFQPLTSNMLNCVAARLDESGQSTGHNGSSVHGTVKKCQKTVKVNSNCSSQQRLLSDLVPKFRLPSGSGMLLLP